MFYILLALADGSKHGYAIMKEVEEVTGGRITLGPGSLYGSIKRLLQDRMIVETDQRPIRALDDERRRHYELTDYGRRVLSGEVERLASAVRLAQKKAVYSGTI
jgi:DNA-binding PadR family transcriptional regulator